MRRRRRRQRQIIGRYEIIGGSRIFFFFEIILYLLHTHTRTRTRTHTHSDSRVLLQQYITRAKYTRTKSIFYRIAGSTIGRVPWVTCDLIRTDFFHLRYFSLRPADRRVRNEKRRSYAVRGGGWWGTENRKCARAPAISFSTKSHGNSAPVDSSLPKSADNRFSLITVFFFHYFTNLQRTLCLHGPVVYTLSFVDRKRVNAAIHNKRLFTREFKAEQTSINLQKEVV